MGLLPHKRALVERLKDEPFSFIGMYGRSGVRAEIAARMETDHVTWRNAMDIGEAQDCLWSTWAVRGFPQFYLIDDQGVIRGRWFGDPGEELERGIEALLGEMRARK